MLEVLRARPSPRSPPTVRRRSRSSRPSPASYCCPHFVLATSQATRVHCSAPGRAPSARTGATRHR